MQVHRINITLPHDLIKQLRIKIPQGKRSEFIAKAISTNLNNGREEKMKHLKKSLEINRKFYERQAQVVEEDFKYADTEILDKLP